MSDVKKIQVVDRKIDGKQVKQIELFMGDLEFRTDVNSERDIRLAERIATEEGLELYRKDKAV